MKEVRHLTTDNEIRIFSDPYRLKIIKIYKESEDALTVKQVADAMGEVPAKVHYHVKKLLSIDILELDHIEIIKGIQAKYYKLTTDRVRVEYSRDKIGDSGVLGSAVNMLVEIVDEFKEELYSFEEMVKGNKESFDEKSNAGIISKENIYLDEDDSKELENQIHQLIKKYERKKSDKAKKCSLLVGVIRKEC